jgi:ACS family hexuronate transporter-like MFS transporter
MLDAQPVKAAVREAGFTIRGLRWWIVGLIFFATLINYIDRLTVSVLAPVITKDLVSPTLSSAASSRGFLLAYTISQGLSGKLYDRIGTEAGIRVFDSWFGRWLRWPTRSHEVGESEFLSFRAGTGRGG